MKEDLGSTAAAVPLPPWQPMSTAPRDGTPFQARIPGHGSDNIISWTDGLIDGAERDCGGWQFLSDQEPPDSWTDGICWTVNEDGVASAEPTAWKPLPSFAKAEGR